MLYNQRIKQCISKGSTDETEGLGLIPGTVAPLAADIGPELKVPHMGWNRLEIIRDDPIFKYFNNGEWVYYVHSGV